MDAETNTVSLINKDMQVIVTMDQAGVNVEDNYIKIYSEDDIKYFDYSGNELSAQELFPENNIYAKKINGKWGFVDKNGNVVVNYEYDMVTEQNGNVAGVKKDGKWQIVDTKGQLVSDNAYTLSWVNVTFLGKYYQTSNSKSGILYSGTI